MATYLVRVGLHGVINYGAFNTAMRQEDFLTTITDAKGTDYHQSTGQYKLAFGIAPTKRGVLLRVRAVVARALQQESPTIRTLNEVPATRVTDADEGWSGLAPVL